MPLLATGTDYVPVFHLGAVGGIKPPFWDQHDEFGDTNMLVVKPEEGASLARALGSALDGADEAARRHRRRHQRARLRVPLDLFGRNAEYQVRAMTIGSTIASLSPGETQLAGAISSKTTGLTRSWEYWAMRVAKAGGRPMAAKKAELAAAKPRRGGKTRRR